MSNYRIDLIRLHRLVEIYTLTSEDDHMRGTGCLESRQYILDYFEKHPELGDPRNLDPEEHIDVLINDPEIRADWKYDLLSYLKNVSFLKVAIGKENVVDAGEFKVSHWGLTPETEDEIINATKSSEQQCYEYIKQTVDPYLQNRTLAWIQNVKRMKNEYGWKRLTIPESDYIVNYSVETCEPHAQYRVFNESNTFDETVNGTDVETAYNEAISKEYHHHYLQFQVKKRLKPRGDHVWGDWWETVVFTPESI